MAAGLVSEAIPGSASLFCSLQLALTKAGRSTDNRSSSPASVLRHWEHENGNRQGSRGVSEENGYARYADNHPAVEEWRSIRERLLNGGCSCGLTIWSGDLVGPSSAKWYTPLHRQRVVDKVMVRHLFWGCRPEFRYCHPQRSFQTNPAANPDQP